MSLNLFTWEWGHRRLAVLLASFGLSDFFLLSFGKIETWRQITYRRFNRCSGNSWLVDSSSGLLVLSWMSLVRLATHLGLAFIILGYITWFVLLLGKSETFLLQARRNANQNLYSYLRVYCI